MSPSPLFAILLAPILLGSVSAFAQTVAAPYDTSYSAVSLGSVPGVPANYGGVTFLAGDPNTLLIGGGANMPTAKIYQIGLVRDADQHIVGFSGTASVFAVAANIDGGLAYGPDGVLFYTRYPSNEIGQILPGSTSTDKVAALTPLGIPSSVGTIQFVPEGFPGAGSVKVLGNTGGTWNDVTLAPDGMGTWDITSASRRTTLTGGPEGLVYIPLGSPGFPVPSVVVSEYKSGTVSSYEVDSRGDAIVSTRRIFVSGVAQAEGAALDPLTHDLVFTTFGGGNQVILVGGFAPPVEDTDEDGVEDETDNCVDTANADQLDTDSDSAGDACDSDDDNDGYLDTVDAFPTNPLEHADTDSDGVGDNADPCPLDAPNDGDGDGICSGVDVCPAVFDPGQADFDSDGAGDPCDPDWDGDGVLDDVDLCIGFDDAVDADGDGIPDGPDAAGDPCDICWLDAENDADADGLCADIDNCPVDVNADQADLDGDSWGDVCDDDDDNDGVLDLLDLFPRDPDESADTDGDGVGDNADLCRGADVSGDLDLDGTCDDLDAMPADPTETADTDGDGVGDNADVFDNDPTEWSDVDLDGVGDNADFCRGDDATGDSDGDLVCDDSDLCPTDPLDVDEDGDLICDVVDACIGTATGDADGDQVCDDMDLCLGNDATGDSDLDGLCDANDNCPVDANPDQADSDTDGVGDLCEADSDLDGVIDDDDRCPATFDPDQANNDLDAWGDACDLDDDNDGVLDLLDNCPVYANSAQADSDLDGQGDACDGDDDADGVLDLVDLCPGTPLNVLFDAGGCSGLQRIDLTCGAPVCTSLRGYIQHVACVLRAANTARNTGLITTKQKGSVIKDAALSCW
jgi:hypothetical protein